MWGRPLACQLRCLWLRRGRKHRAQADQRFSSSLLKMRIAASLLLVAGQAIELAGALGVGVAENDGAIGESKRD
jgi:hypothetical protein